MQVGVTGFCQGGALSCLAAEHAPVSCAVPFYGYPKSYPSKVSWLLLSPLTGHPPQREAVSHTRRQSLLHHTLG